MSEISEKTLERYIEVTFPESTEDMKKLLVSWKELHPQELYTVRLSEFQNSIEIKESAWGLWQEYSRKRKMLREL